MVSMQYKGRIHKAKFTLRSLRYVLSDQAARAIPALQRRWLLPVDSISIQEAAVADFPIVSQTVETPYPECLTKLGIAFPRPLRLTDHVYSLEDVIVTGWAGAMIKDGLFLANRPQPNWVSALRARPHRLRTLADKRAYFNLMAPIPARGHIFHWLFDAILPLVSFLEASGGGNPGLIVNAARSEFQEITLAYLRDKYGIEDVEPLAQGEAVRVPHLRANIPVPHIPRALQPAAGLCALDDLATFIEARSPGGATHPRIYISRRDARLRRVSNEEALAPLLKERGFERLTLSGLPIARQVQLFRQAQAVAAPHGAGLAHIAWCQPGTKITEFFPNPDGPLGRVKNASADMWLIAMQRGLAHRCYLAGPLETRKDAFSISPSLLARAFDEAESEGTASHADESWYRPA